MRNYKTIRLPAKPQLSYINTEGLTVLKICLNCQRVVLAEELNCRICGIAPLTMYADEMSYDNHQARIIEYQLNASQRSIIKNDINRLIEQIGLGSIFHISEVIPNRHGLSGNIKTLVLFKYEEALDVVGDEADAIDRSFYIIKAAGSCL